MNLKKLIVILCLLLIVAGCQRNDSISFDNEDINQNELETNQEESANQEITEGKWIEVSVNVLKIRNTHSTSGDQIGILRLGDRVEVFEVVDYENYKWYRLGPNAWIADDGARTKTVIGLENDKITRLDMGNLAIPTSYIDSTKSGNNEYPEMEILIETNANGVMKEYYINENNEKVYLLHEKSPYNLVFGGTYDYLFSINIRDGLCLTRDDYNRVILAELDRSDERIKIKDFIRFFYNGNLVLYFYGTYFEESESLEDDYYYNHTTTSYRINNFGQLDEYYSYQAQGAPEYTIRKYKY